MYIQTYLDTCNIYICMYVCMYVCMSVCVCVFWQHFFINTYFIFVLFLSNCLMIFGGNWLINLP